MTVTQAMDAGAARLRAAGIAEAVLDAELLLRHVLRWDRASLFARGAETLPSDEEARYFSLIAARASRRPLQHLTGTQAFWRHEFAVGPAVLVPRPETEVLVEAALEIVPRHRRARVIDVGTGSGCIALSLAAERPDWTVIATDLSKGALAVAAENAGRLGLRERVRFVRGDLLSAFADGAAFDLVASNPPYVTEDEWRDLAPEVRDHDPRTALVPREGVPALYARLFVDAARVLRGGGAIAVEIGAGQAAMVTEAAERAAFESVGALRDLQDIPRVIVATRSGR